MSKMLGSGQKHQDKLLSPLQILPSEGSEAPQPSGFQLPLVIDRAMAVVSVYLRGPGGLASPCGPGSGETVRGTLAPGDGPTSGSSGKMLSTSLLYLGRRAPQQPHTPGTGTRMPCELSLPGPGWAPSEKPNPFRKQKGPSIRAPGPQSFLLFPRPTPL